MLVIEYFKEIWDWWADRYWWREAAEKKPISSNLKTV